MNGRKLVRSMLVVAGLMAGVTGVQTPIGAHAVTAPAAAVVSTRALIAGGTIELQVGGVAGVPADAVAVVLNVTASTPTAGGFITVWPCGQPQPNASNLNYAPGDTIPNLVITKLGTGGKVCILSLATTDILADVSGYFPATSDYTPIPNPTRILDTRNGTGGTGGGVVSGGRSTACRFSSAVSVAFCDSFDQAAGDPTKRSGDLEPVLWGVSRTNMEVNLGEDKFNNFAAAKLVGCGATQLVLPPKDVRICNGRLLEAVNDVEGQPTLAMYPKQPFDIGGGRTGTVVFDVSADSEGPHATWPEFWWTDQPVPAAHGSMAGQQPFARNSFGFSIAEDPLNCGGNKTGIDRVMVTRNYAFSELNFTNVGCITMGSPTGGLNHIELRISQNHVEIWGTDAGATTLKQLAVADNPNITMTKGLVWLEHVGYNACKFNTQCDHTFAWDNLGFDGPTPYRDLSFDVPDANVPAGSNRLRLGYAVAGPVSLNIDGVFRRQTPTGGLVTFNWFPYNASVPSFRINGRPWHYTAWPFDGTTFVWRTIGVTVPANETRDGTNTIELQSVDETVVSNINLILIAGAAVPTG